MEKNENSLASPALQRAVQKLIAEEYYAYQLYFFSKYAVKSEDRLVLANLFGQIAADELDDHMKSLVEWCYEYGVDVPATEREFKSAVSKEFFNVVDRIKKGQDARYYLDVALKLEEMSMDSYKTVLEMDDVPQFTDL